MNPLKETKNIVSKFAGQIAPFKKIFGFAEGGYVPGLGTGDTVPAMLTPGELVLNRAQQQQLSSGSVTINLNISAGAVVDKPAIDRMLPQIIEGIRRASVNGQSVLSTRGIR